MREIGPGEMLVALLAGIGGGFIFLAYTDFALLRADWCGPESIDCFREWVGALSGWAAAVGAGITVFVLWKTLDHMRRSTEQQLRAYISFDDAMLKDVGLDSFHLHFKIINRGATPAHMVQIVFNSDLIGKSDHKSRRFTNALATLGYVGPKEEAIQKVDLSAYCGEVSSLQDGDTVFNFYICVTYDTVFEARRFTSIEYESQFYKGWKDHPLVARFGMSKAD